MTLDEVKQELSELHFKGFSKQDVFRLVDKIYEDFETKSCEGCIHHLSANGNIPLSCMDCSRFYADGFEEMKK